MSKQTINIGASPNDGTGTPLRTSFDYTNQNFTELYTALGGGVGLPGATTQVIFNDGGTNLAGDAGLVYNKTTDALTVAGLVTAGSATITGDLTVDTSTLFVKSSNDRVGIGTITPDQKLEVFTSTADTRVRINSTSVIATEYFRSGTGVWLVGSDSTNAFKIARGSNFGGSADYLSIASATADCTWYDAAGGTRMTLNSTGLGVGRVPSSFAATLKVIQIGDAGSSSFTGRTDAFQNNLVLNAYDSGSNAWIYIQSTLATRYSQNSGSHQWFNAPSGTAGNAITFTQAMTLDASGNLLVGSTTSFAQPSRFVVESNSQTTAICGIFNDARTDSASAINIAFYRNGIKVGSVDCTNAATSYVTSSDYRLKEDVQPLSGGLARVSALKPSIYKWKINGSNGEGFIAHELAEVVPAAVTGEKDAVNKDGTVNPQGVDLSKVVPILVAAIQELTARVQTLEAR